MRSRKLLAGCSGQIAAYRSGDHALRCQPLDQRRRVRMHKDSVPPGTRIRETGWAVRGGCR